MATWGLPLEAGVWRFKIARLNVFTPKVKKAGAP